MGNFSVIQTLHSAFFFFGNFGGLSLEIIIIILNLFVQQVTLKCNSLNLNLCLYHLVVISHITFAVTCLYTGHCASRWLANGIRM